MKLKKLSFLSIWGDSRILFTNFLKGRYKTNLPMYWHFSLINYYAIQHKVTIGMIGTYNTHNRGGRGHWPLIVTVTILLQLLGNIYIYNWCRFNVYKVEKSETVLPLTLELFKKSESSVYVLHQQCFSSS